MTTVNDITTEALEMTGIKSGFMDLSSDNAVAGMKRINGILDKWNMSKLLSSEISSVSFPLTPGKGMYTIGSGGDVDVSRPVEIIDAYSQDANGTNCKIKIVQFDEWNSITQRDTQSDYPSLMWYNPKNPLGEINVYAVPSSSFTVLLTVKNKYGKYLSTSDSVILPDGYKELLVYQLAVEMCSFFGEDIPPFVYQEFKNIESKIKNQNAKLWLETTIVNTPANSKGMQYGRTFISPGI